MSGPISAPVNRGSEETRLISNSAPSASQILAGKGHIAGGLLDIAQSFLERTVNMFTVIGISQILQSYPKMPLLLISLLGGMIGTTAVISHRTADIFPKNATAGNIASLSGYADIVIRYLGDFGSIWGTYLFMANQYPLQGNSPAEMMHTLNNYFIPISILEASMMSIRHFEEKNGDLSDDDEALKKASSIGDVLRGFSAPTFMLGLLQEEGVLSMNSTVSKIVLSICFVISSLLGVSVGITKFNNLLISKTLLYVLKLLFENVSLAATLMLFPNAIFAKTHNGEKSPSLFCTTIALSALYFTILTASTIVNLVHLHRPTDQQPRDRDVLGTPINEFGASSTLPTSDEE